MCTRCIGDIFYSDEGFNTGRRATLGAMQAEGIQGLKALEFSGTCLGFARFRV